jgi:LysR family transcriptional regulator, cell division regulator
MVTSSKMVSFATEPVLNSEELRRFVAVATLGSFTQAAHSLRVAQPLLSRSIAALESRLGVVLLARSSRNVTVTPAGQRLVTASEPLLQQLGDLPSVVAEGVVPLHGAVRIGATETVAAHLAPRALAHMLALHRGVHPMMRVATSAELSKALAQRELDVVLTFNNVRHPSLLQRTVAMVQFALVVASSGEQQASVLETFIGSREVEDETERVFPIFSAWRQLWPNAKIRLSTNSSSAHVALVLAGAGVSILPICAVVEQLAQGRLCRAGGHADVEFGLKVIRRRGKLAAPAQAFVDGLRATLGLIPGVRTTT